MRISADNHRFELESLEKRAEELEVEREQNAGRVEDEKHQHKVMGAKLQDYRSQQAAKQAEIEDLKNREESLTDACTVLAQKRDALTKRVEDAKALIISPAEDLQKEVADNRRRVDLAAEKADAVQASLLAMTNRTALLDAAARKLSSMDVLATEITQSETARKDVEHKHLLGEQNFAQLKKKVEGMRSLLSSRKTSLQELEKAHQDYHGKVERDEQKKVTDQKKIKDEIMTKQGHKQRYVQQISDLEKAVLSLEKAHVDLDAEVNASREQWRTREIKIAELKDAYSRRVDVEIIQRLPTIEWRDAGTHAEMRGIAQCASPSFGGGVLSPPPRKYPSPPQMPSVPAGARAEPGWRMLNASPSGLGLTSPGPQSPGVGTPVFSRGTPHRLGQGLFSPSPRASPGLKAFMSPSTSMRPMIIASPGFLPPPRASAPRSRGTPKPLRV
jgi:chromosome segregation ATPase